MNVSHSSGFVGDPAPVYFDRLTPQPEGSRPWVMMVHGGSHTGSCYLVTADRRPGWAHRFAARGFGVIVPDWPGHGRSGGALLRDLDGELISRSLAAVIARQDGPVILLAHSMGAAYSWRAAELCRDQVAQIVAVAPAPPGNDQTQPSIEAEDADRILVRAGERLVTVPAQGYSRAAREMITTKLIGDSTRFPADSKPDYANLVSPTAARLVYERLNVRGSQVSVQSPDCLAGVPITIVTGSNDVDHPREVDQSLADWWLSHGAAAEHIWLPDRGIDGNGHMLMMESNSDSIADLIIDQLEARLSL